MNARIKILASLLILLSFQQIAAQKVVAKNGNGMEYRDDEKDLDDMNAITAPSNAVSINIKSTKKKVKKKSDKKKTSKEKIASVKKVEKLIKQKKRLRFRNKRKKDDPTKCFKTAKKPCDSDKKNK